MWKKNTAQVIPSVRSSTAVIPKSLLQSQKTYPASEYVHTNAKICNSWNMFNCKNLFKIINKTIEPNPVDYTSQDR